MVVDTVTPNEIGPWDDGTLVQSADGRHRAGLYVDSDPATRFLRSVVRVFQNRQENLGSQPDKSGISIFILEPNIALKAPDLPVQRAPMLDRGRTDLMKKIWFSSETVVSGKFLPIEANLVDDDNALFNHIDAIGVGEQTTVILDLDTPMPSVRLYPCGVNYEDNCIVHPLNTTITPSEIFETIATLHKNSLITSDATTLTNVKLWENVNKWFPTEQAEKTIQGEVRKALTIKLPPSIDVRSEVSDPVGRYDICIEQRTGTLGMFQRHMILELKVTRSFRSSGATVPANDNKEGIAKGLEQAINYRDAHGAIHAALCCFDMEKDKQPAHIVFAEVLERAEKHNISLHVWPLFAKSDDLRKARKSEMATSSK